MGGDSRPRQVLQGQRLAGHVGTGRATARLPNNLYCKGAFSLSQEVLELQQHNTQVPPAATHPNTVPPEDLDTFMVTAP